MIKSTTKELFFSVDSLKLSWERYVRIGQAEVKDHVGIDSFQWELEENIKKLHKKIVENKYQPSEAFKFKVPKSNGMQRILSLLQVEDAVIYQTFANNIATDAYKELLKTESNSYGFPVNDQVALGLGIFNEEIPDFYFFKKYPDQYFQFSEILKANNKKYYLKTDFTAFYDLISHELLIQYLNEKFISSEDILDLLKSCLKEWAGKKGKYYTNTGIPQTEVASPFFGNLILHELDLIMINKGIPYYRYLDDIWVFSDIKDELETIKLEIDTFAQERGMCINPAKTSIEEFYEIDLLEMEPSGLVKQIEIKTKFPEIDLFEIDPRGLDKKTDPEFELVDFESDIDIDYDNEYLSSKDQSDSIRDQFLENCVEQIFDNYNKIAELNEEDPIHKKNHISKIENACYLIKKGFEVLDHFDYEESPPLDDSIDFKIFFDLLSKYIWKCKPICNVLSFYQKNEDLKKGMLEILYKFKNYEWVIHHMAKGLKRNQKLENSEVENLLSITKQTDSWFSKSSLYPLMLINCANDSSIFRLVKDNLLEETNLQVLKNVIFNKNFGSNEFFTNEEIKKILMSKLK